MATVKKKTNTHRLGKAESNLIFRLLATSDNLESDKFDEYAKRIVSSNYSKYAKSETIQKVRAKRVKRAVKR